MKDNDAPEEEAIVQTTAGRVRGARTGNLVRWRGVPYASAPTGNLRFVRPTPPQPWREVRDVLEYGPSPIQPRTSAEAGGVGDTETNEDCLTINIVRTSRSSETLRPVMVWIYGGAFQFGSARAYDGDRLAERGDVVVVTFNYRVGPFGFLDLTEYVSESHSFDTNVGLRDQVAALTWIRDNIAAFGGNPDDVTLFGESAGAISVTTLMAVPAASGLFHRAIAQSSSPSSVFRAERVQAWANWFIEALDGGDGDVAERLMAASPDELLSAADKLADRVAVEQPGTLAFAPVVDGEFLPERPLEAFHAGRAARVPLIIGTNAHEGRLFQMLSHRSGRTSLPTRADLLLRMFACTDPSAQSGVISAYASWPKRQAVAQMAGDIVFWYPSTAVADAHSRWAPVWAYRFDYASPMLRVAGLGATHGTEIPYVFDRAGRDRGIRGVLSGGRIARRISSQIANAWVRFARSSTPPEAWPAYDEQDRNTFVFDRQCRIEKNPRRRQREAWGAYRFWDDGE